MSPLYLSKEKEIRAENYTRVHLQENNIRLNDIGKIIILTSTFVNSYLNVHEYTQEAFIYVGTNRKPNLFLTFNYNPSRQDVAQELLSGLKATD